MPHIMVFIFRANTIVERRVSCLSNTEGATKRGDYALWATAQQFMLGCCVYVNRRGNFYYTL